MQTFLGSSSTIKTKAVEAVFGTCVPIDCESGVSEQPIGDEEIFVGATNRKDECKRKSNSSGIYIGIESGVVVQDDGNAYDYAMIVLECGGVVVSQKSELLKLPSFTLESEKTWGMCLKETTQSVDSKDPHMSISGVSRSVYIEEALRLAMGLLEARQGEILECLPCVEFKRIKKFYDVGGLLMKPKMLNDVCQNMSNCVDHIEFDMIGSLDARGFLFSPLMSVQMNKPSFMIRKKGKLPNAVSGESYKKEYSGDSEDGTDTICINADVKGKKIVLVDDLVATGGTLVEATNLIKKMGGEVVACVCVVELVELKGRDKIESCVYSVLKK